MSSRHILTYSAAALAVFGIGMLAGHYGWKHSHDADAVREYDERYAFIRPLLICQPNEDIETSEFAALEGETERVIAEARAAGQVARVSVYYRDLNAGRWMGVNEDEAHSPASLLKVPLMISYFKKSESDPLVLERRHLYERTSGGSGLSKEPLLVPGRRYSVKELIRGMIVQSDNEAKAILERNADTAVTEETYRALGIADPYSGEDGTYEISAKEYSLFFRILYNGTYLDRERSNEALNLMSETEFLYGLRAGTPENVKIAHKFGLRIKDEETQVVELSDCGIVYHATAPYLLCVMTEGSDPYVLSDVIARIARAAYEQTGR